MIGVLAVLGLTWLGICGAVGLLAVRDQWRIRRAAVDAEPVWGCDCCQDEAEEIAALEAIWEAS